MFRLRRKLPRLMLALALFMPDGGINAQEVEHKAIELKQTQQQIEASRQRQATLKKHLESMESGLGGLQKETGTIAQALKNTQQQQHDLQLRLAVMEREAAQKQKVITERKKQIAALLATVLRVSQVPSYAVLAMENGLEAQIHASRALGLTTRSIKRETDILGAQLNQLAALRIEIAREKEELTRREQTLEAQRMELAGRVEERRLQMQNLHSEEMQEQSRIAQLTRQSKDLETLVASLEEARVAQRSAQYSAIGVPIFKPIPQTPGAEKQTALSTPVLNKLTASAASKEYDLSKKKGALLLPVAGNVEGKFGQIQASNDTLKGLLLETPAQAVVTAPYGGEVMFTGPFRDYGQMVIIRHSHRYHTLLAGLSRINVAPGQFLLEGEPIGAMGTQQDERRLYLELREQGKAIDPAPWFGGVPRLARN